MSDEAGPSQTEAVETVQGEVVDIADAEAHHGDDLAMPAIDGDIAGAAEDVLVLDTWQIQIPATGDASVDAALSRLSEVEGLPPVAHADVYESVHAGLQDALADLDRN